MALPGQPPNQSLQQTAAAIMASRGSLSLRAAAAAELHRWASLGIAMIDQPAFQNPFNNFVALYAMRFAQPLFFGQSPAAAYAARLSSGTASLVKLQGRYLAITCHHVYDAYRAMRAKDPQTIFQIGRQAFDPVPYLLSESQEQDVAVLDVSSFVRDGTDLESGHFFEPPSWPPGNLQESDLLAFAGFPGIWRQQLEVGYLRFYSVTSGTAEIAALGERHLVTRLVMDECESAIRDGLVIGSLGGLSGGPVFVWRLGTILRTELVGFATEYQESLDLLYVRRVTCISEDVRIVEQEPVGRRPTRGVAADG